MKRVNRIRKNTDFKKVIAKNKVSKNDEYVIYSNNNNLGYLRVGVSVSSKLGNAVVRNKIKRQIRNMINILMNFGRNIDIVVIVRDGFKKNSYDQNLNSLSKLIKDLQ